MKMNRDDASSFRRTQVYFGFAPCDYKFTYDSDAQAFVFASKANVNNMVYWK